MRWWRRASTSPITARAPRNRASISRCSATSIRTPARSSCTRRKSPASLLNLISNGFYAASKRKSENGGREFRAELCAATRNLGKSVEIRIRDNGTGIPPEVKEKMFNPFFTTKPAGEGTGLGLSMSHDIIVKQHGGRIDVETEPGVFTEFIITLPRHTAASPA